MVLINQTGPIGILILTTTNYFTGSLALTLLAVIFFSFMACLALRMPLEMSTIIVFPVILGAAVASSAVVTILVITSLYIAVLVAKNLMFE